MCVCVLHTEQCFIIQSISFYEVNVVVVASSFGLRSYTSIEKMKKKNEKKKQFHKLLCSVKGTIDKITEDSRRFDSGNCSGKRRGHRLGYVKRKIWFVHRIIYLSIRSNGRRYICTILPVIQLRRSCHGGSLSTVPKLFGESVTVDTARAASETKTNNAGRLLESYVFI